MRDEGNAEMQGWYQVTQLTGDGAEGSLEEYRIKGCRQKQKKNVSHLYTYLEKGEAQKWGQMWVKEVR